MALTLVEAERLSSGLHKLWEQRVQTHGLERVLRWVFRRPKYRWVSLLQMLLEGDSILDRLAFTGIEGNALSYTVEKAEEEELDKSLRDNINWCEDELRKLGRKGIGYVE